MNGADAVRIVCANSTASSSDKRGFFDFNALVAYFNALSASVLGNDESFNVSPYLPVFTGVVYSLALNPRLFGVLFAF